MKFCKEYDFHAAKEAMKMVAFHHALLDMLVRTVIAYELMVLLPMQLTLVKSTRCLKRRRYCKFQKSIIAAADDGTRFAGVLAGACRTVWHIVWCR